jgi:hypothetical protein
VNKTASMLAAAFLAYGCGGDRGQSPNAVAPPPSPASPAFLTVVSGETHAPVTAARVVVAGAELVSDGQGRVGLPGGISPTALVDVVVPGFFDRQTQISRAGTAGDLTLWPRESPTGLTEQFTSEVVYTTFWTGVVAVPGAEPLTRWAPSLSQVRVVHLGPADDSSYLEFSARALDVQRAAVDEMMLRPGGNRYPDNDRSARGAAHLPASIACRR